MYIADSEIHWNTGFAIDPCAMHAGSPTNANTSRDCATAGWGKQQTVCAHMQAILLQDAQCCFQQVTVNIQLRTRAPKSLNLGRGLSYWNQSHHR